MFFNLKIILKKPLKLPFKSNFNSIYAMNFAFCKLNCRKKCSPKGPFRVRFPAGVPISARPILSVGLLYYNYLSFKVGQDFIL